MRRGSGFTGCWRVDLQATAVPLGASKAWYLLCFRDCSLKSAFPRCQKRSNGSQLSAREAQKHCACAQIQV